MCKLVLVCVASVLVASGLTLGEAFAAGSPTVSTEVSAAVADSSRPADDRARDADRKPAETLAFSGVRPGDKVADYGAGGGYFTRLFADVVGPKGHVYAVDPSELLQYTAKAVAEFVGYAGTHLNVTITTASAMEGMRFPEKLDLFWIAQNYHDLPDKFMGPVNMAAFNKAVYVALKPGGLYLVLDHAAAAEAPAEVTETLHRIEPSRVRREIEAAGFKFEGESTILANGTDPHTISVFDKSIRGSTDQFIFKFRKPKD